MIYQNQLTQTVEEVETATGIEIDRLSLIEYGLLESPKAALCVGARCSMDLIYGSGLAIE